MLSSSVENLSARRYNSSMIAGGSRDKDWIRGGRPKAPSEVLQDRIHTVDVDLLDRLTEPTREIPDGFLLPFED